jgi:hypothetical protein
MPPNEENVYPRHITILQVMEWAKRTQRRARELQPYLVPVVRDRPRRAFSISPQVGGWE